MGRSSRGPTLVKEEKMRTSQVEATAAVGRLGEPLTEMKNRLTGAVGDAQDRLMGARDSAGDAIAENPLRWTMAAFVAGLIVGAILGYRRADY
jgi:ElaB/YqjD/DUF883 family membrane-anchored ribosome-binding protein